MDLEKVAHYQRRTEFVSERNRARVSDTLDLSPVHARSDLTATWIAADTVAILDKRLNVVRLFAPRERDGMFTTGRPLQLPSRTRAPRRLLVNSTDVATVLYADGALLRLGSTAPAPQERHDLPRASPDLQDACGIGDSVVARETTTADGVSVHLLDSDGLSRLILVHDLPSGNSLAKRLLANGSIGCDAEAKTFVLAFDHLPVLFAYSLDGNRIWGYSYALDVAEVQLRRAPSPGVRRRLKARHERVRDFFALDSSHLLVQLEVTEPDQRAARTWYRRLVLDSRTGASAVLTDSSTRRLVAYSDRRAVIHEEAPLPRLIVVSR